MKDNKHMKLDKSLNEVKIKQMKKIKTMGGFTSRLSFK